MADEEIDIGLNVTAEGADVAARVAEAVKTLRKELAALYKLQNSSEAKAARQQAADELSASSRSIAAQRRDAQDRERNDRQQSRELSRQFIRDVKAFQDLERSQLVDFVRSMQALHRQQVSDDRQTAAERSKIASQQSSDQLAASARSIAAQRRDSQEKNRAERDKQRQESQQFLRDVKAFQDLERKQLIDFNRSMQQLRKQQLNDERQAEIDRLRVQREQSRGRLAELRLQLTQEREARRAAAAAQRTSDRQARDERLASSRQIAADRRAATDRERQQARQLRDEQRASARQIAADRRSAAANERARGGGGPGDPSTTKNILEQATALGGLAKAVIAAATAFAGFQGFRAFVQEGLEFNKILETANLGIASLVTSQTIMTDSSNRSVEGIDKLRVAQALATTQIQKLRIAGLQTAATTEQLAIAFQQAVGVGLRWGLTLDQIRIITIQVSQAAHNLGVPLNQLNEEIRSLLTGTITPRNTRIATALGITNSMIRQAQQAGTLFDLVTKKMQAFTIAGEETQKTFVGVLSNLREALQNLAGDATRPLFDELKAIGQATLEDIFDMKHARISDKFRGILDVAKSVFGDLGKLLADAIEGGLGAAEEFSKWLQDNRVHLTAIFESVKLISGEVGLIFKDLVSLLIPLGEAAVQTNAISVAFNGVALVVAEIRSLMQVVTLILGTIGAAVINLVMAPMIGWLRITARIVSIFNEDLAQSIDDSATAGENLLLGINNGIVQYAKQLANGGTAIEEFTRKLIKSQEQAQITAAAQARLSDTLVAITNAEENQTDALDKQLSKKLISQKAYADQINKIRVQSVQKQIEAQKAYFNALDVQDNRERQRTLSLIKELKRREDALKKNVTLKASAEPAEQDDSAVKRAQAANILIKQALEERLKDLQIMLDKQEVSYDEFYGGVIQANLAALDQQKQVQWDLLAKTTDLGAQEKILAQIQAFEQEKNQIIEDNDEKRRQAEIKLGEAVTAIHVQVLRDEGRLSEARALEIGDKFKNLIAQLKKEGRPEDVSVVERLLGIETAKTRLDELTKHASEIQQTLSTRLSAINTEQEANAISEREARDEIVKAYQAARRELIGMVPEMRELAKETKDKGMIDNVNQLEIKLQQMGTTVRRIADDFFRFKATAKEASTGAIANLISGLPGLGFQDKREINALKDQLGGASRELDKLLKGPATAEGNQRITELREEIAGVTVELSNAQDEITTWRDLLLDAARSIVQALQQVVSEMLATLLVQKLISGFSGFAGGGSVNATHSGGALPDGRLPVATGGHIRGAGTPTSDSIPAWLSDGEYVVRAAAVRSVGVDLLNQINSQGNMSPRLRSRNRGYAEGGVVQTVAGPGGSLSATLGLEEGLVLKHLETSEGSRAIVSVIAANRKAVRQLLR